MNEIIKSVTAPNGTKIKVTIRQEDPIDEKDFFILRDDALINMAECLTSLADSMKSSVVADEKIK